jgi:hypothetical protein
MATQTQLIPPHTLMKQMICAPWVTQSIYVVAELGIADLVADGPRTVENLAAAVSVNERSLRRVLRALASVGVFRETPTGFEQTPMSECLISVPGSLRAWARMGGVNWQWQTIGDLFETVKTGRNSIRRTYGKERFEMLADIPGAATLFNDAMTSFSSAEIDAVLASYDFSGIRNLADVGGGYGGLLAAVLDRYPEMTGILYDLQHVVAGAAPFSRCEIVAGDFFVSAPTGADGYMMKHILHDWNDEKALTILRNVRRVIPPEGRLLVIDAVISPGNEPDPAKLLDIMMLLIGGQERAEKEFEALFRAAGFRLSRIVVTRAPVCIVEGIPID